MQKHRGCLELVCRFACSLCVKSLGGSGEMCRKVLVYLKNSRMRGNFS